jgi:hypothetical protein
VVFILSLWKCIVHRSRRHQDSHRFAACLHGQGLGEKEHNTGHKHQEHAENRESAGHRNPLVAFLISSSEIDRGRDSPVNVLEAVQGTTPPRE